MSAFRDGVCATSAETIARQRGSRVEFAIIDDCHKSNGAIDSPSVSRIAVADVDDEWQIAHAPDVVKQPSRRLSTSASGRCASCSAAGAAGSRSVAPAGAWPCKAYAARKVANRAAATTWTLTGGK